MKQLIDFSAAIIFTIAYFATRDIHFATKVLMVSTCAQMALTWLIWREIETAHCWIWAAVMLFGSLTLLFNDKRFLFWKPTVINWSFSVILLISHYVSTKNLAQRALEGIFATVPDMKLNVPEKGWTQVNRYVALYFFFSGSINIFVAFTFDEATWVTFKLVGMLILNCLGMIMLFSYLYRHMEKPEAQNQED